MIRAVALAVAVWLTLPIAQPVRRPPIRGLTATAAVARTYDSILDADFLKEIHDTYFHDAVASHATSARLLALADARQLHEPALASVRARLNMARQLARLGERQHAIDLLTVLIAERPARPHGSLARAEAMLKSIQPDRFP